ncbi:MAG: glycoside hydrolase family 6 protein [Pseudonocardia sp.]|uniref:glycoside hydrolase family 6 protein n=1 Tax=Pseudonocardia sp. TaxID=60912 RepID=UPI001AD10A0B|nr:glycoside hydrolase family 6 protein [Pseudonocardia sp.]MBN9100004.1 glycoside hydrolase family 6 protein [Pseudonocardia sp.]
MSRLLVAALALALIAGCSEAPTSVLSQTDLFVDPTSPAATQAAEWQAAGRTADAEKMRVIAAQPIAQWLTSPTGQQAPVVADEVRRARAAGRTPFFVAYHVPFRDCGSFSGGGATSSDDYRAWIREVAGALDGGPALVVLEPDAVAHEVTGCGRSADRSALLADAIGVLDGAGAEVYLDAGNPGFVTDPARIADALRRSGVERAAGFSLNVANFWPTPDVVAYGKAVSAALGGAHFVVDTSRNGNGRPDGETVDGGPAFCNPPGRKLGQAPTQSTGEPLVDAYLWVKRVGESDGSCRPGEPAAGQWWPDYALGLAG